ncbi:hypothetical protein EVAR_20943_1 [Eumeta japonica]|uniref:Uncharacterized protein n=1 Tax=Eumeta variegata TaxID=151549 RepID=A0A4C1UW30_EUMVA|nr:hypothetical protein EVAR_20943_1 [Eumeta japonica]
MLSFALKREPIGGREAALCVQDRTGFNRRWRSCEHASSQAHYRSIEHRSFRSTWRSNSYHTWPPNLPKSAYTMRKWNNVFKSSCWPQRYRLQLPSSCQESPVCVNQGLQWNTLDRTLHNILEDGSRRRYLETRKRSAVCTIKPTADQALVPHRQAIRAIYTVMPLPLPDAKTTRVWVLKRAFNVSSGASSKPHGSQHNGGRRTVAVPYRRTQADKFKAAPCAPRPAPTPAAAGSVRSEVVCAGRRSLGSIRYRRGSPACSGWPDDVFLASGRFSAGADKRLQLRPALRHGESNLYFPQKGFVFAWRRAAPALVLRNENHFEVRPAAPRTGLDRRNNTAAGISRIR